MSNTKSNRWPNKKVIYLTIFLILSTSGLVLAWMSLREDIIAESTYANLEFEIDNPNGDYSYYINVNDRNYHPWKGFVNDDPFIGDDWETYWVTMEEPADKPVKFRVTNRSDREVYMRINIVPEWQTERLTQSGLELVPILAPEADLRWLVKSFAIGLTEAAPTDNTLAKYAAWQQLSSGLVLSSVVSNEVYLNGEPTGAQSFYVYVLDQSNNIAVIKPPNAPAQTDESLSFLVYLDGINQHMNIPEYAHSLKLTFSLEVLQGTPQTLAYAQDYTHTDVSVPWIYNPRYVTWQPPFGPGTPVPPMYTPTRPPSPIPTVIP
jgi:hypothetical protein